MKKCYHGDACRIHETRQLRGVIECFAARLLAERKVSGQLDLQPLVQAYERLAGAARAGDYDEFIAADVAFHRVTVELADVAGLVEAWDVVQKRQIVFQVDTIRTYWPALEVLADWHRPILDAILDGDRITAQEAVLSHLDAVWYRIESVSGGNPLRRDPLRLACAYIDLHLQQPLKLQEVATVVCRTSTSHLSRLMRERFGKSFTAYLRDVRLRRAAMLLRSTAAPIREIASRVGYRDPSRFAEHFCSQFSLAPRNFRRSAHGSD